MAEYRFKNDLDYMPSNLPQEGKDMVDGYCDGRDPNSPEPSANRSFSYRHGFANGRDDLRGAPRDSAVNLRRLADEAEKLDASR